MRTFVAALVLFLVTACSGDDPTGVSAVRPEEAAVATRVSPRQVERIFSNGTNDWEPTVAADPVDPYVYLVTTRYGAPACPRRCPDPALVYSVSNDGGTTFGPERYLCVCRGIDGQNDPQVAVARDGTVYAAWLNGFVPGVVFSRSSDHGRTWTRPKAVMGALEFSDKPILVISPSGRDVYIAFNASDSYMVASHDRGATFSDPVRTNRDGRYYFADGGYVAPNGDVTFAEASYTQESTGPVFIHTMQSVDGGRSWRTALVDVVAEQPDCISEDCPSDFLGPTVGVAGSGSRNMVLVYNGALASKQPQRVFVRRSNDGGASWSARSELSDAPRSANSGFPTAVGSTDGDFRAWYMDDRNGPDTWNVWFRRSTDGGRTWSDESRLSNAGRGAPYKRPGGFAHPYGDYGGLAVTSLGSTVAVWGEGASYAGPGGTWIARFETRRDDVMSGDPDTFEHVLLSRRSDSGPSRGAPTAAP